MARPLVPLLQQRDLQHLPGNVYILDCSALLFPRRPIEWYWLYLYYLCGRVDVLVREDDSLVI